jgi:hypothetical protein
MKDRNPDSTGTQVARLLRALASLIEKSGPDEVNALLRGRAVLSKFNNKSSFRQTIPLPFDEPRPTPPDLPTLAKTLQSLNSRDEGDALLLSASLTRRELERLGRLLGTPILKTDNMERLTQKILEASIGSRLSSEAIRGVGSRLVR